MIKFLSIFLVLFLISCTTSRKTVRINCHLNITSFNIRIPKYHDFKILKADAESGVEYIYWYDDSAAFYISTFKGGSSLNYANIRNLKGAYAKRSISDSIKLNGIDFNGKYWREQKYNNIYIGYVNVKAKDYFRFDNSFNTIKFQK